MISLQDINPAEMAAQIYEGHRASLARAITLMESNRPDHRALARTILHELRALGAAPSTNPGGASPSPSGPADSGNLSDPGDASDPAPTSFRIGITGVPGVGKSSFIEKFGLYAIERGHRVAVLAIDPTSALSKGSILGDKTRMNQLSHHPDAYIRPTATGGNLGGVARATRESMLLLEAAGFDFLLIETVGVGQSEITVANMVDFFLLLMIPGAGDDLQGIKRGIMEMADLLVVNKADGDRKSMAKKARTAYAGALHLFPPKPSGWTARAETCSALTGDGIENIYERSQEYRRHAVGSGFFTEHRRSQEVSWFDEQFQSEVMRNITNDPAFAKSVENARNAIVAGKTSPYAAVADLLKKWSLAPSLKS